MSEPYMGGGSIPTLRSYTSQEIRSILPKTVLDFGAGRGLMGQLCREILGSDVQITAIEGCPATVPFLQDSKIYNSVFHSMINEWVLANHDPYDLAIFGDVLEHLPRRKAFEALATTLAFSRNIIVNVPLRNLQQEGADVNPLEEHKAFFTESCFLSRYYIQEFHLVNAGHAKESPGWEMMNCWIVGQKRRNIKRRIKHTLLFYGGVSAKKLLAKLGQDIY